MMWIIQKNLLSIFYGSTSLQRLVLARPELIDVWQPADGFVMDIDVLEDDRGLFYCKIVEINSFNCSGIYDCDERLIIQAVERP